MMRRELNPYPAYMSAAVLFCLIIFFLHFPTGNSEYSKPLAPALYVFGDSLLDSGDNDLLPTASRANYFPYGVDFPGGPTGRFTNGKTVADFIAEYLGLPLPPPYLNIQILKRLNTLTGLNYASSSCGILPETGLTRGICLSLDAQINLFQATVELELPKHYQSSEELSGYLSKSIFLIAIGSNDYLDYVQPNIISDTTKGYSPQSFAQLLIDELSHKFERLYRLGARKVVMFEIGPIGCLPAITRKFKHSGKCVEEVNQHVSLFNNQLATVLQNLTSTLQGSTFILGQTNWLAYDTIINPSRYGIEDSSNPCCTTWANGTSACIPELLKPCPNRHQYYFWDGFHPTETVYSGAASRCVNDNSVCSPLNIKELSQI